MLVIGARQALRERQRAPRWMTTWGHQSTRVGMRAACWPKLSWCGRTIARVVATAGEQPGINLGATRDPKSFWFDKSSRSDNLARAVTWRRIAHDGKQAARDRSQ
eukprot:353116-Chlamydomonas_euryale.AAC.3